jgi:plasmanylethanolamine desaturase
MEILLVIIKVIGLVLAADFITGTVHFLLDQYGSPETPIIGKYVIDRNARHHQDPRQIVESSYLKLTWTSWLLGTIIVAASYYLGILNWEIVFTMVYGANANMIHKWTHQTKKENGKFVGFLQKIKLVQSRKHHGWHHKAPFDVNYCILTDWLNPILDKIRFWETTTKILMMVGMKPVSLSK